MPELPNIVRERLKASRPTAAHPDADVLTAFSERALAESEGAVVAEHLARCHDCRDILALALPATVTAQTAGAPLPARGGWLRAPVLRWGVVAAGLAVLAVGGLLQHQRRHVAQAFIAAREATAPVPALTAQASHGEQSVRPTPGAAATSANSAPANASGVNAGSTIPRDADTTFKQKRAAVVPRASFGDPVKQSVPLNAAPSSAGGAETQSELVATNTSSQAANQPYEYRALDQKKDREQGGVGGRASMDVTVDKAKAPEMTTVEVSSAAPTSSAAPLALRWAISDAGRLLRSFDQGRTWASVDLNASSPVASQMVVEVPQRQKYQQTTPDTSLQVQSQAQVQSPAQKQSEPKSLGKSRAAAQRAVAASVSIPIIRAVSAAGLEVWAGGSAGVLYHSVNGGEQWTRVVPSASGTLLTGDVIAIAFSDPQHGQLTTSTQELWTTFDAGLTWQKR